MSIDAMNAKVKELRELRRMADELAGEIESLQDEIKAEMTYKAVKSSRLDSKALKAELPEVAARYMKETTSRRFLLA